MIDDRIPRASLGAGFPRANALIHALLPACDRFSFYPLVCPDESKEAPYAELDSRVDLVMFRGYAGLATTLSEFADAGFDVLWISRPENLRCVDEVLKTMTDIRDRFVIVYDAEALYAPRTAQAHALRGDPLSVRAADDLLDREVKLAGSADLLVSVSEAEASAFRAQTGRNTLVLGFTAMRDPTVTGFTARRDFGFVGGIWGDGPNEDSLLWYAANAMHEVRARTGATLRVVGTITSQWVIAYGGSEMVVHGPIPDLRPFFEQIRVFIAPTRFAAGLPQKLIDAASAGVPIVATSILADALGWRNEKELLIENDAAGFATACVRLYKDEKLWKALRDGALHAVHNDYSPEVFSIQTAAIVEAIRSLSFGKLSV